MKDILCRIRQCTVCKNHLLAGVRPVVQLGASCKVIIVGQAPGRKVHLSGIPWDDASGKKLRQWLDVDEKTFYDPDMFSILPMGFCYPGKGISGDLPPRQECAPLWHSEVLSRITSAPLIILIGQFAQRYYLKKEYKGTMTDTVRNYREYLPRFFPIPHPSPRNQNWVKVNPWFEEEVLPVLQRSIL